MSNGNHVLKNAVSGLDPSFLKENPDFISSYNNINWNNIDSLNNVLKNVDKIMQKYPTPNASIKKSITEIFTQILGKYPFLYGYWKKFTSIQYQLYDLEASLKTLEAATIQFPQSLELWCDYLRVLIVNFPNEIELIRSKIEIAKKLIGWQFYSHVFWDLVIDFETKQGSDLISIYDELIIIPLHQYAKYIEPYKKLLNDPKKIKLLQTRIKKNQLLVGSIWKFECKIKQNFFNLVDLPQNEIQNWEEYLTYLTTTKGISTELIQSVFERCLVPCCFLENVWIKYVEWAASSNPNLGITGVIDIYQMANKLLPWNKKKLRLHSIQYMKRKFSNEDNRAFIFDTITSNLILYMRAWSEETAMSSFLMKEYLPLMKRYKFSSNLDMPSKEILSKQTAYVELLDTTITHFLNNKTLQETEPIQTLINEQNIPIVIVELIKVSWLIIKNNLQTRKYFNFFSKIPIMKQSVPFWLMYYKFEKANKNFIKLNIFINNLGNEICLPVQIINDIIKDYGSFYLLNSNITDYRSQENKNDTNSSYIDPLLLAKFKISKPRWTPNKSKRIPKNEWYKSNEYKENGHIGIIIERPLITNSIIERNTKYLKHNDCGLPTFRNVEKIQQQPKYNDFYTEAYLKK